MILPTIHDLFFFRYNNDVNTARIRNDEVVPEPSNIFPTVIIQQSRINKRILKYLVEKSAYVVQIPAAVPLVKCIRYIYRRFKFSDLVFLLPHLKILLDYILILALHSVPRVWVPAVLSYELIHPGEMPRNEYIKVSR